MGQFVESHCTQLHITMYKLIVLSVVLVAASAQFAIPAGYGFAGPVHAAGLPYPYAAAVHAAPAGAILPHTIPQPQVIGRIEGAPEITNYALPPVRDVAQPAITTVNTEKVEQPGYSIRY